jgi:hypothetical protein
VIEILVGLVFAILMIVASRLWDIESWSYSLSLVFLPLIYMVFGIFADGENIVLMEFYFGLPYFAIAILLLVRNFRGSVYLVAAMWSLHAFYDVFHNQLFVNTGVFSWYPYFCAAVDFSIGAYLFLFAHRWPSANMQRTPTNV